MQVTITRPHSGAHDGLSEILNLEAHRMDEIIYLKKSDQKVPRPTKEDNNKVLSVVDGKPAWVSITKFGGTKNE